VKSVNIAKGSVRTLVYTTLTVSEPIRTEEMSKRRRVRESAGRNPAVVSASPPDRVMDIQSAFLEERAVRPAIALGSASILQLI